jgi:hypothetical protein
MLYHTSTPTKIARTGGRVMKRATAIALSMFTACAAHASAPNENKGVTNQYIALIYVSQSELSCVISGQRDKEAIRDTIKGIIGNSYKLRHMTGGQTEYPSLRLEIGGPAEFTTYSFYNVSMNEFGQNYIKLTYRDKYVYGLRQDLDHLLQILHWGRGDECHKRSRNR